MRIIAGSARGRRLQTLQGLRLRPTRDMVREAVFSSLMPRLPGSSVLDLFAGTGALGIEALSRGAVSTVFIDIDQQACDLIHTNLTNCGWRCSEEIRILRKEAARWLTSMEAKADTQQFDIIFADPPYNRGFEETVLRALSGGKLLSADGVLVLESDARQVLPVYAGKLFQYKTKTYGDTRISYYHHTQQCGTAGKEGNTHGYSGSPGGV
ncbi:MAG: 16S rRNA (guanine(966)-N(2))-methyltransferase RsmD [Clostridiales bacterium]|nr:16S rRNA (guanine(966)-N(2))-methyltransferase RsmD [Clostridiales bacterium]